MNSDQHICNYCLVLNNQRGYTALIRAAANGHTDCVALLVEAESDKEAKEHVRIRS